MRGPAARRPASTAAPPASPLCPPTPTASRPGRSPRVGGGGMCGIAGWAGLRDVDDGVLARMCAAVAHRGPDDDGAFVEPGRVGLGFRRLSIIDLENGAQPLRDERGAVVATCNGEIYNFQALRG